MRERVIPEAVAARLSLSALMQDLVQEGWEMDQDMTITLTAGKYRVSQTEFGVHTSVSVEPKEPAAPKEEDDPKPSRRGSK